MTAPAICAQASHVSRESLFALLWDFARPMGLATMLVCLMPPPRDERLRSEVLHDAGRPWDDLPEDRRARYRTALLELVELHDHNRKLAAAAREKRGQSPKAA